MSDFNFTPWGELVEVPGEEGPITVTAWTVACTSNDGQRWLYCGAHITSEDHALEVADKMSDAVNGTPWGGQPTRPGWTPDNEHWNPGPVVYGSPRHERLGDRFTHSDVEPELLAPTRHAAEQIVQEREYFERG